MGAHGFTKSHRDHSNDHGYQVEFFLRNVTRCWPVLPASALNAAAPWPPNPSSAAGAGWAYPPAPVSVPGAGLPRPNEREI
jgi:hypothetical protein